MKDLKIYIYIYEIFSFDATSGLLSSRRFGTGPVALCAQLVWCELYDINNSKHIKTRIRDAPDSHSGMVNSLLGQESDAHADTNLPCALRVNPSCGRTSSTAHVRFYDRLYFKRMPL